MGTKAKKLKKHLKAVRKDVAALVESRDEASAEAKRTREKVSTLKKRVRAAEKRVSALEEQVAELRGSHSEGSPVPDDSWTVVDLRAQAREEELPGYSQMNKAELIDELSPDQPS